MAKFRLVFERETGKPKGYGFCEYLGMLISAPILNISNHVDIQAFSDTTRSFNSTRVPL
jgi:hypothetical protein